jgi:uncharacterized protein with PIN domain
LPDDPKTAFTPPVRAPCQRCGGALELATKLEKAPGRPAYEIFRCVACGLMEWVAQRE